MSDKHSVPESGHPSDMRIPENIDEADLRCASSEPSISVSQLTRCLRGGPRINAPIHTRNGVCIVPNSYGPIVPRVLCRMIGGVRRNGDEKCGNRRAVHSGARTAKIRSRCSRSRVHFYVNRRRGIGCSAMTIRSDSGSKIFW